MKIIEEMTNEMIIEEMIIEEEKNEELKKHLKIIKKQNLVTGIKK